ncbi:hypothetical protein [Nitrospira sp. Kam-Ns4a]
MRGNRLLSAILGGLAFVLASHTSLWAQADQDEGRLQTTRAAIDSEAASKNSANRVQALSQRFNVPASQIETMQGQKQGWGEITIQLAMAQHLTKTDPTTYPTMTDALTKIQSMRNENMGWGRIAKELGFKLGPVVADVQQARQQLVAGEVRQERTGQVARPERVERPDRPMRPERPERPERPMKPERPLNR